MFHEEIDSMQRSYFTKRQIQSLAERKGNFPNEIYEYASSCKQHQGICTDSNAPVLYIDIKAYYDNRGFSLGFTFKNNDMIFAFLKHCPDSIRQLPIEIVGSSAACEPIEPSYSECLKVYIKGAPDKLDFPRMVFQKPKKTYEKINFSISCLPENAWVIKEILFALYKFDTTISPIFIGELLRGSGIAPPVEKDILDLVSANHFPLAVEIARRFDVTGRWLCDLGKLASKRPDPWDASKCDSYSFICFMDAMERSHHFGFEDVKNEATLNYYLLRAVNVDRTKFHLLLKGESLDLLSREQQTLLYRQVHKSYRPGFQTELKKGLFNTLWGHGYRGRAVKDLSVAEAEQPKAKAGMF